MRPKNRDFFCTRPFEKNWFLKSKTARKYNETNSEFMLANLNFSKPLLWRVFKGYINSLFDWLPRLEVSNTTTALLLPQ